MRPMSVKQIEEMKKFGYRFFFQGFTLMIYLIFLVARWFQFQINKIFINIVTLIDGKIP
jgi:hypothetical protein